MGFKIVDDDRPQEPGTRIVGCWGGCWGGCWYGEKPEDVLAYAENLGKLIEAASKGEIKRSEFERIMRNFAGAREK